MAAGTDGARLMKVARLRAENGNGTALEDLEKLLEEAKGSLEEKIRNGIDPAQARIGDIAVEITHSGFHTYARVWLKVADGARGWNLYEMTSPQGLDDLFWGRDYEDVTDCDALLTP
ncbi:unnamed protein product [Sphagnum balticum]